MLEFERRYVLIPVLLGIAFVGSAYFVTESGHTRRIDSVNAIHRSQERTKLLSDLQLAVTDAESAQRGFILTANESYLGPYRQYKEEVSNLLDELRGAYHTSDDAKILPKASHLGDLITTKFAELDATLALLEKSRSQAMGLVRTDFGKQTMDGVRGLAWEMRQDERRLVRTLTNEWADANRFTRIVATAGAALNVILILVAGVFVSRDLNRRAAVTVDLESQVAKATNELSELSTYLQRLSERERSALARELHDELGGLLIALKMDLNQIKSKLDLTNVQTKARWDRVEAMLSAGIDLKRRVIEQLRPSLLDNMGLVAALKWQAGEICWGANLKCVENYPEDEPEIAPDAAIAFFRVAQESLTNIVKHARASHVEVSLSTEGERLTLRIEDDGVGIAPERLKAAGSHGIAGMRHRLKSYGGDFKIESRSPKGTIITASVPLSRVSNLAEHAP
jgi:signal transduction histidine kinase